MPDTYGSLPLPVTVPAAPPAVRSVGDPLLGWLASYLQAVINAALSTAWATVAPNQPPVRTVFVHDPHEAVLKEQALPALFLFRDDGASSHEWLAEDYRVSHTTVSALWVTAPATQEQQSKRYQFMNAVAKAIDAGIERGRDPAWVVAGDTDPQAAALGSILSRFAAFSRLELRTWKREELAVDIEGGTPMRYDAMSLQFDVEEILTRDTALGTDPNTQLPMTVTTSDGAVLEDAIYT